MNVSHSLFWCYSWFNTHLDVILSSARILRVRCPFIRSCVHLELRARAAPGTTHAVHGTPARFITLFKPYCFFHWLFSPGLLSHWIGYRRNRDNEHWNQCKINFCLYYNFLEFVIIWKTCCPHLINDTVPAEVTKLCIDSITSIALMLQYVLLHVSCHV